MASTKLSELAAAGKISVAPDYLYGEEAGVSVAVIGPTKLTVAPLTGTTVTLPANLRYLTVNPAATLAALTIVLPPSPKDGQLLSIGFSQAITTLTLTVPGGGAVSGIFTAQPINTGFTMMWEASTTTWRRAA